MPLDNGWEIVSDTPADGYSASLDDEWGIIADEPETGPTLGERAGGFGLSVLQGTMDLPKLLAPDAISFIGNAVSDGRFTGTQGGRYMRAASDFFQRGIDAAQELKPDSIKREEANQIYSEDAKTGEANWNAPNITQVVNLIGRSVSSVLPGIKAGQAIAATAKGLGAKPVVANVIGYGTSNAAIVGTQTFDQTYREAYKLVRDQITPESFDKDIVIPKYTKEQARQIAAQAGVKAGEMAGAVSWLTGGLGQGLAVSVKGNLLKKIVLGTVVDAPFEGLEEAGQQAAQNKALQPIDGRKVFTPEVVNNAALGVLAAAGTTVPLVTAAHYADKRSAPAPDGAPPAADTGWDTVADVPIDLVSPTDEQIVSDITDSSSSIDAALETSRTALEGDSSTPPAVNAVDEQKSVMQIAFEEAQARAQPDQQGTTDPLSRTLTPQPATTGIIDAAIQHADQQLSVDSTQPNVVNAQDMGLQTPGNTAPAQEAIGSAQPALQAIPELTQAQPAPVAPLNEIAPQASAGEPTVASPTLDASDIKPTLRPFVQKSALEERTYDAFRSRSRPLLTPAVTNKLHADGTLQAIYNEARGVAPVVDKAEVTVFGKPVSQSPDKVLTVAAAAGSPALREAAQAEIANRQDQPSQAAVGATAQAKAPWEMTREEFRSERSWEHAGQPEWKGVGRDLVAGSRFEDVHQSRIEQAIAEGKSIPAEVLADYPDLKAAASVAPQPTQDVNTVAQDVAPADQPDITARQANAFDLQRMAGDAGWAEKGGRIIRDGQGASQEEINQGRAHESGNVVGRTKWIPHAQWYQQMRQSLGNKGLSGRGEIQMAINQWLKGGKLGKKGENTVNWMLAEIEAERQAYAEQQGVSDELLDDVTIADLSGAGLEVSGEVMVIADLMATASVIDEAATERAAIRHENDVDLVNELKRIINDQKSEVIGAGKEDRSTAQGQAAKDSEAVSQQTDLAGSKNATKQAIHDAEVERKRKEGASPPGGMGAGDLFSGAAKQTDIQDVTQPSENVKPDAQDRRANSETRKRVSEMSDAEKNHELLIDSLTGLGNKRAYDESDKPPSFAFLDVDSLKWVNDEMGHDSGDALLKAVGEAVSRVFNTKNAFRLAGDEFVITGLSSTELQGGIERVSALLAQATITTSNGSINKIGINISFGIGDTLHDADQQLARHKADREASGARAARGEEPPGVVRKSAQGQQDSEGDSAQVAADSRNASDMSAAELLRLAADKMDGGKTKTGDVAEVLLNASAQADESLADALEKYEGTGEIQTVGDLANEVERLIDDGSAPESLQQAVDDYRQELADDHEMAGRGDMDEAEESFLSAVRSALPVEKAKEAAETRLTELLQAPTRPGGKPVVSFKTQREENEFKRGFRFAIAGGVKTEQQPGVPANEQKYHDAFANGSAYGARFLAAVLPEAKPEKPASQAQDTAYHYTDGTLGMTSSGAFTRDRSRWITFTQEEAASLGDRKPAYATREGIFVGVNDGKRLSSPAQGKIKDFGEVISGAKKEYAAAYKDKMSKAMEVDVAAEPFSKSWPEPDYKKLLEAGNNPRAVALVRAMRDEIPTKPSQRYRLATWVAQVQELRGSAERLLSDPEYVAKFDAKMAEIAHLHIKDVIGGRAELYQLVGHEKSLKGIKISRHEYSLYGGEEHNPPKMIWTVEREVKATAFSNMPRTISSGDTKQQAIDGFVAAYSKLDSEKNSAPSTTFQLYYGHDAQGKRDNSVEIGKKVGRNVITIKAGFASVKEARQYIADNNDELTKILEAKKAVPSERYDINQPRVGQDHRANLSMLNAVIERVIDRSNAAADSISNALIAHADGAKLPGFIDVPLETMPMSRQSDDMDADLNKLASYRLGVFAKFLGNLDKTDALTVQSFSKFDVPGKRLVQSAMLNIGHDLKVRRSIIELIPVDVVDNLAGAKFSADGLFSDQSMLSDGLAINGEVSVGRPNPAVLAFVRAVAGVAAKVSFTDNIARVALKNDPAVNTGQLDSILGKFSDFDHNVTPGDFQDAFSFFGVQFGNYVGNDRRQQDLNDAYDALMDMAAVLDIPPKALSLNGELGLAFGARGSGGKNPASAHFEPDQVVINLTKGSGAGSLAHEWWHSLSDHFSKMRKKSGPMTEAVDVSLAARNANYHYQDEGVRKEMIEAFGAAVRAINSTGMRQRSGSLDNRRTKAYWGAGDEMAARSFERYIIAKLQDNGFSNDYLANVVSEEYWNAADALGIGEGGSYPYPTVSELPAIREGFDKFFSTIETKETDRGVALFSRVERDRTNIDTAMKRMGKFVDYFATGKLKDEHTQILGPTPTVLQALGAKALPIQIDGATIRKVLSGKHKYDITEDVLRQMPEGLYDPLAVFDSSTGGGMVAVTELRSNTGKPVIAIVHFEKRHGGMLVNDVASVHEKTNAEASMLRWVEGGLLRYVRNENDLSGEATRHPLPASVVALLKDRVKESLALIAPHRVSWMDHDQENRLVAQDSGKRILTEADVVNLYGAQFSRTEPTAGGLSVSALRQAVAAAVKNLSVPVMYHADVQALRDATGLGDGIPNNALGMFYKREIHLVANRIRNDAEAQAVLFHEVSHAGIAVLYPGKRSSGYVSAMTLLSMRNENIRIAAAKWRTDFGADYLKLLEKYGITGDLAQKQMRLTAIEEALADLSGKHGEVIKLKGLREFIAKIQAWLRANGFDAEADWMEGKSDAEALQFIQRARGAVTKPGPYIVTGDQVAAFSETPLLSRSEDQTQTEAFKRWFGESVVTDNGKPMSEGGKPLVVYHSTLDDVEKFDKHGRFTGYTGVSGISVTDSAEMASRYLERYGETRYDGKPFEKNIIPLYVKAEKPLYRDEPFSTDRPLGSPLPDNYVSLVEKMGYDALIRNDAISRKGGVKHSDAKNAIRGREIIVFDPSNVKSAIGNIGTFDPKDANILYSKAKELSTSNFKTDEAHREQTDRLERTLTRGGNSFTVTPVSVRGEDARGRADYLSGRSEYAAAEKIAKLFSKKIVWVRAEGDFKINGVIDTANSGVIYIDVRATVPMHVITGHELSHHIEQDNPALYEQLTQSLNQYIVGRDEYRSSYSLQGTPDLAITKEITGDLMGDAFNDPAFWDLVGQQNPSLLRKLADAVTKWINRVLVRAGMRGFKSEQYVTDLKAVRDILAKTVAQYASESQAQGTEEGAAMFSRSKTQIDGLRDGKVMARSVPIADGKWEIYIGEEGKTFNDSKTWKKKTVANEAAAVAGMRGLGLEVEGYEQAATNGSKPPSYGKPMAELLNIFDRNQIVQIYGDSLPELKSYKRNQDQMVADRNKILGDADVFLDEMRKLPTPERDRLATIAHTATLEGIDPSEPYKETSIIAEMVRLVDGLKQRKSESGLTDKQENLLTVAQKRLASRPDLHSQLRNDFNKLTPAGQRVFIHLRDAYQRNAEKLFAALEGRISRMNVEEGAKASAITELRKEYDKLKETIYFPLARFGDHVVIGEKNGVRAVEYHASEKAAAKAAASLRADGYEVKQTTRKIFSKEASANKAVSAIVDKLKTLTDQRGGELLEVNRQEIDLLLDDVNQVLIQMLPDQSFRRHFQHRKNVPGYSNDFIRAFADSMWKSSNHIAALDHGDQVTQSIQDMQKRIDGIRNADTSALQDVVNHLIKREDALRMPISPITAAIGQVGFLAALASVSNFFVNLTQTPVLTFPYLGGRYGYSSASFQLTRAFAAQAASFRKAKTLTELKQILDLRPSLKGDELAAFNRLFETGKIDITQAHDLIDVANKDNERKANSPWNVFVRVGALPQHISEVVNRQVTALATIRLELQKSKDANKAFEAAMEAIDQTHYDYEKQNRALIMHGNVQRVVFMFKQYAQKTAFLWARTAQLSMQGADAQTRKVARKQLAGMIGMQFLVAGALGLPIFLEAGVVGAGVAGFKIAGKKGAYLGVIGAAVIAAASSALDDDDDDDLDTDVRNWLADNVGTKWGEVIARGAMRLTGMDISSRVGASELFLRKPDKSLEGKDAYWKWVESAGGFAFGYGANVAMGLSLMDEGQVVRGLEKIIPVKQVRDLITAGRFGTQGVTNLSGDKLLPSEPTNMELVVKAAGFTPARIAEVYESNNAIKTVERSLNNQRARLMDRWWTLRQETDTTAKQQQRITLRKDTDEFNRDHPTHRISGEDRLRSAAARRRSERLTENGIQVSRKHRALRERGNFANLRTPE